MAAICYGGTSIKKIVYICFIYNEYIFTKNAQLCDIEASRLNKENKCDDVKSRFLSLSLSLYLSIYLSIYLTNYLSTTIVSTNSTDSSIKAFKYARASKLGSLWNSFSVHLFAPPGAPLKLSLLHSIVFHMLLTPGRISDDACVGTLAPFVIKYFLHWNHECPFSFSTPGYHTTRLVFRGGFVEKIFERGGYQRLTIMVAFMRNIKVNRSRSKFPTGLQHYITYRFYWVTCVHTIVFLLHRKRTALWSLFFRNL